MASVHAGNGWRIDAVRKIPGGNADDYENKGELIKIGIRKILKTHELKIDLLRDALQVEEGWKDENGDTISDLLPKIPYPLLFVNY